MVKYPFDVSSVFILLFSTAQKKNGLVSLVGNAQGTFSYKFQTHLTVHPPSPLTLHIPREQDDHSRAYSLTSELMLLFKLFL